MIKAKFENIGPIKKAELELGDLTIIAGQNNTGKTYLAHTLYNFLNFWKNNEFNLLNVLKYPKKYGAKIKEIAKQLRKTGSAEITLDEYDYMSGCLFKAISELFSKEFLHRSFSSSKEEFEKASFELVENRSMKGKIFVRHDKGKKALMRCFFQGNRLKFEIDNWEHVKPSKQLEWVHTALGGIVRKNIMSPFLLPTHRNSIPIFYKELDFTRNRLVQELQNSWDTEDINPFEFIEKKSARYAASIQNNINFVRDLPHIVRQKSEMPTDALSLLKNIVGGDYKVEKDVIKFISNKKGKNRFEIPLHLASSLVCGLPGLYFYLKHSAEKEDLLIVDEPESYLSPRNQILMARLLALCVNNGIKVLITTHSDYIVKEINNLIMLHQDFEAKQEFLKKYKEYTEKDHLDPASVRAYVCENSGLSACDIDEGGIREMSVFDDAIDDINLISEELNIYTNVDTVEDD